MPRKEIRITITDEGRDKGKVFVIKEMPASQAEKWATRAFFALTKAGFTVPDEVAQSGFAGIAMMGLRSLGNMDFAEAEILMDAMFRCIQRQPGTDPNIVRPLIEEDIEEVITRFKLRIETFNLHAGFSIAGSPSPSLAIGTTPAAPPMPHTSTSRGPARPVSHSVRQRSTS